MSDASTNLEIRIKSTGDLAAFGQARAQADQLKASIAGLKEVLSGFGVGFGLAGIGELLKGTVEYGMSIEHLAEQAHISTDALQALSFMAVDAGMNQDKLATTLEFLNKSMALAAEGSSKQNAAIEDLGLNTADLLAMPVQDRIVAIAKAYEGSADKTRAWADVVVLLGKDAAKSTALLDAMAKHGVQKPWWTVSKEDLDNITKTETGLTKIKDTALAIGATSLSAFIDELKHGQIGMIGFAEEFLGNKAHSGQPSSSVGGAGDTADGNPEAPKSKSAIIAAREATLAALPEMIAAHRALQKALEDEAGAYETSAQKAARLRREAADDETQAAKPVDLFDNAANVAPLRLQTEAAKLRAEANKLDAEATAKRLADLSKEAGIQQQITDLTAKKLPLDEQQTALGAQLLANKVARAALDPKSETYAAQELKLTEQELAIRKQMLGVETQIAEEKLKNLEKSQQAQSKAQAIAMAAIEHDPNLTDSQKWQQKLDQINRSIAQDQADLDKYNATANDMTKPESVRNEAAQQAQSTQNDITAQQTQKTDLGPDPTSFTANFSNDLNKLQKQWGTLQQQIASGLTGQIANAETSVGNGIDAWLMKTKTFGQAMSSIWTSFESSAIAAFSQMVAKYAISKAMMFAIDEAIAAKGLLLSIATAAKSLVAWIPAAITASISSWGLAAGIGAAAVIAIIAAHGGFEEGGLTPGREGQPVGIVHGAEYVFSAPAVRSIGAENLERAHRAALSSAPSKSSGSMPMGRTSSGGDIHIHTHSSPEEAMRAIARSRGGRHILADLTRGTVREMS